MSRNHPNFTPARPPTNRPTTREATSFLRSDEVMAALLPTLEKMAALEADARRLLPGVFSMCRVQQLREGQLHIAVPNAALATRIRQMLPKLQAGLREKGWPVDGIRIKVQMMSGEDRVTHRPTAQASLPTHAVQAFAGLAQSLEAGPLRDALQSLVKRRR